MKRYLLLFLLLFFINACDSPTPVDFETVKKPNVVLIYTDDLGYGDISANGATGVTTPHIDALVEEGLNFTDSHCSSATCTPSRVTLLTGSYAFRSKAHILRGDAPLKIKPSTFTMADIFKKAGYSTAVVGKWHLGLGDGKVDWNKEVKPGPRELGFDYSFLIPATGDRTPCVYLENDRVVDHDPSDPIQVSYKKRIGTEPSGKEARDTLKMDWSVGHNCTIVNGISRIGWMTGGQKARWVDEDMADVITHKATNFIEKNKDTPFFLFFATHDIHVPRVPHSRFVGKSTMGPRGDAIVQMDWCVGEISKTLKKLGLNDNTLIIFSSDNGPVLDDGYKDFANEKLGQHKPAGLFRAGKYSLYEGGTRVPFVVKWPGVVKAGTTSKALMGQVDLCASVASIVGVDIPEGQCVDSRNAVKALVGQDQVGRSHLLHEAGRLALRQGKWKFISKGRGVIDGLGPWKRGPKITRGGALFDVEADIGEKNNLAKKHPEKLKELEALVEKIRFNPDK